MRSASEGVSSASSSALIFSASWRATVRALEQLAMNCLQVMSSLRDLASETEVTLSNSTAPFQFIFSRSQKSSAVSVRLAVPRMGCGARLKGLSAPPPTLSMARRRAPTMLETPAGAFSQPCAASCEVAGAMLQKLRSLRRERMRLRASEGVLRKP